MFVHYYDRISEGKISTSNIIKYKQEPIEVTIQIERQSAESLTPWRPFCLSQAKASCAILQDRDFSKPSHRGIV